MAAERPKVVAAGAHILDVLGRYVEAIPEGQGGTLIEEIRLSPAGAAGGVAVCSAKLGAEVVSLGAIGSDDAGEVLTKMLGRFGVDTSHLVRRDGVQTSSTILPIRPNGDRPALHVIGANGTYTTDDVPWEAVESAGFVHVGAPEILGPDTAAAVLERSRENGATTTADILADGWPELLDMLDPVMPHIDYLLPNEDQVRALTGEDDAVAGARALIDRGAGCVVFTRGPEGSVVVTADGDEHVPAVAIDDVVDTTGCGDAFTAGFVRGLSLGREPGAAARVGAATASFVAQGLGTDAGEYDLDAVLAVAGS